MPRIDLLALIGIFGYGCLMTLVLVVVQGAVLKAAVGTHVAASDETTPQPVP